MCSSALGSHSSASPDLEVQVAKNTREAHYTSLWIWFIVQTPLFQVFRLLYPPSFIICMCTWGIYTEENVLFIEDLVFGKEMDLFTTLDTKVNKKCLEVEQTVRTVANDLLFFVTSSVHISHLFLQGILNFKRCFCQLWSWTAYVANALISV